MRPRATAFHSVLADSITRYLAHKRALGRRFRTEERELHLLDRFLDARGVARVEHITAEHLAAFLTSRPRRWPRSYNHLLGAVRRLLDWLVGQDVLQTSPLRATPRRVTAQRVPYLFDAAFSLKQIGDYVGHRSPASTEIYTKVAVDALREVALGDGETIL